MIAFARGGNRFDAAPEIRHAPDFDAFRDAVLADRAPKKGLQYIAAPFATNGGGRPVRGKDYALARAWLPLDIDGIAGPEVFADLRHTLAVWRGFAYETFSSTYASPRCRVILALSRSVTRDEGMRLGVAIQARIEMQFGESVRLDDSVYRAEQPCYLPPVGAASFELDGEPVDVDAMLAAAPPGERSATAGERADENRRLDVRAAVRNILAGEHWHDSLVRLAAHFVARRMPEPDAVAILRELFEAVRDGSDRWRERAAAIPRAVRSAVEKFGAGEVGDPNPWPGDGRVSRFLEQQPPALEFFAASRLLASRAHALVGLGGVSKTRALYHLGIGAVTGRLPWDWQVTRTGSAALLLTEDTTDGAHRTLRALVDAMALTADERARLAERLFVFPLAGRDCRLLERDGATLRRTPRAEALMDTLRGLPAPLAFVGLDPALALTEGDELDQGHQRRLGEFADSLAIDLDCCVVLSAHASKASANADEPTSHTARGAGSLTDAMRAEFTLRTMTATEGRRFGITDVVERKALVQLVATKGNELPPEAFAAIWLRRGPGGALAQIDLTEQESGGIGPREAGALDELRRLAAVSAPTLASWRDACVASGLVRGSVDATTKSMQRVRDALLRSGLIERGMTRGVYVPTE